MVTVNDRAGMVRRAAELFDLDVRKRDPFAHRKLHAEARAGNRYVLAKLASRGLRYDAQLGIVKSDHPSTD